MVIWRRTRTRTRTRPNWTRTSTWQEQEKDHDQNLLIQEMIQNQLDLDLFTSKIRVFLKVALLHTVAC